MATIERLTPVGEDIRSFGGPWHIAGVTIDNPSGSWLTIPAINRYIPPYTLQWMASFTPTILSLDVLFTDSPTGTPSELVGGPVTVVISDTPVGDTPGFPSGAQQAQSPIGAEVISEVRFPFALDTIVTSFQIVTSSGNERIIPIRYYGAYSIGQSPGPRGAVGLVLYYLNPGAIRIAEIAISPQAPSFDFTFTPGIKLPPGMTLEVATETEPGGGRHDLATTFQYYIQRGG